MFTPAIVAGQLLHPPPFLESTDLFWTFRPDRGIVLDEATVFDADIYPHFVLFGASNCRPPWPWETSRQGWSGQPCISITPAIRLRMENKDSVPINSPSFVPRMSFQWLSYRDEGTATKSVGLHIGHHSNGAAGHLFKSTATEQDVTTHDNASLVDLLALGLVAPDTEAGNFSANYIRLSFDLAKYEEEEETGDTRLAGHRLALGLEVFPDRWLYGPLRNGVYPRAWLRADAGIAFAPAPLCRRQELFLKTTTYRYGRRPEISVDGEWGCIFSPGRGLGLFSEVQLWQRRVQLLFLYRQGTPFPNRSDGEPTGDLWCGLLG